MNAVVFTKRNEKSIVYGLILLTIVIMLIPLWYVTSIDEEEFRFAVISSVLHSRALLEGYYPFWTSSFGFGMPHPFLINFNYHPLLPIFAFDTELAINLIHALHLLLGSAGMYCLCRLYTGRYLALLGVASYLMASPNINYLYTDLWLSQFIGWSIFPLIIFFGLRLAKADSSHDRRFFSISLGFLVAMVGLNGHPSQAVIFVISLLIILSGDYRNVLERLNYFVIAGAITLMILAGKLYYVASEASQYSSEMMLFKQQFGWGDIWSMFFRPIVFGGPSAIMSYNLEMGSRVLFVGGPLMVTALVSVIWHLFNRKQGAFIWPLIVFLGLYVIRPEFVYSFVSSQLVWREPLIITIILVSLIALNDLSKKNQPGKNASYLISASQVVVLVAAVFPFYYQMMAIGVNEGKNYLVLKNLLEGTDEIKKIQELVRNDEGRVYISRQVVDRYRSPELTNIGLTVNSLPYFGMRVLNGSFKGIYYGDICPGPYMYGGIYEGKNCNFMRSEFLNTSAVKYLIKYDDEFLKQDLIRILSVGDGPEGPIGFYRNQTSLPEAMFMSKELLSLSLPEIEECEGGGLGCKDLAVLSDYRLSGASLELVRSDGSIKLIINGQIPLNSIVMISEYAHPNWVATWHKGGKKGSLKINKIAGAFMGLDVPAGVEYVVLDYVDKPRQYLELLTLVVIILCVLYLIAAGWIRSSVKSKEIEA